MDKILTLRYNLIGGSGKKKDIQLAFIDVDEQLAQLARDYDSISKVRRLITIQEIRNRLFELCNLCVHNMNIREFVSHEPGDETPQNCAKKGDS